MAAGSAQPARPEWFTDPDQVNHRRYEALRAYFVDGLSYAQAGERFGYTRWAMINMVWQHRAGRLDLFAPARRPGPPPGTAPAKNRARARVIELRRRACRSTRSPPARRVKAPRSTAPGSDRSSPRRLRPAAAPPGAGPRASTRARRAATPGCPAPRPSTSAPGRTGSTPAGPGCCWSCPT